MRKWSDEDDSSDEFEDFKLNPKRNMKLSLRESIKEGYTYVACISKFVVFPNQLVINQNYNNNDEKRKLSFEQEPVSMESVSMDTDSCCSQITKCNVTIPKWEDPSDPCFVLPFRIFLSSTTRRLLSRTCINSKRSKKESETTHATVKTFHSVRRIVSDDDSSDFERFLEKNSNRRKLDFSNKRLKSSVTSFDSDSSTQSSSSYVLSKRSYRKKSVSSRSTSPSLSLHQHSKPVRKYKRLTKKIKNETSAAKENTTDLSKCVESASGFPLPKLTPRTVESASLTSPGVVSVSPLLRVTSQDIESVPPSSKLISQGVESVSPSPRLTSQGVESVPLSKLASSSVESVSPSPRLKSQDTESALQSLSPRSQSVKPTESLDESEFNLPQLIIKKEPSENDREQKLSFYNQNSSVNCEKHIPSTFIRNFITIEPLMITNSLKSTLAKDLAPSPLPDYLNSNYEEDVDKCKEIVLNELSDVCSDEQELALEDTNINYDLEDKKSETNSITDDILPPSSFNCFDSKENSSDVEDDDDGYVYLSVPFSQDKEASRTSPDVNDSPTASCETNSPIENLTLVVKKLSSNLEKPSIENITLSSKTSIEDVPTKTQEADSPMKSNHFNKSKSTFWESFTKIETGGKITIKKIIKPDSTFDKIHQSLPSFSESSTHGSENEELLHEKTYRTSLSSDEFSVDNDQVNENHKYKKKKKKLKPSESIRTKCRQRYLQKSCYATISSKPTSALHILPKFPYVAKRIEPLNPIHKFSLDSKTLYSEDKHLQPVKKNEPSSETKNISPYDQRLAPSDIKNMTSDKNDVSVFKIDSSSDAKSFLKIVSPDDKTALPKFKIVTASQDQPEIHPSADNDPQEKRVKSRGPKSRFRFVSRQCFLTETIINPKPKIKVITGIPKINKDIAEGDKVLP